MNAICYVSFVSTLGNVKAIDKVKARYTFLYHFDQKTEKPTLFCLTFYIQCLHIHLQKTLKETVNGHMSTPKSKEDEEFIAR